MDQKYDHRNLNFLTLGKKTPPQKYTPNNWRKKKLIFSAFLGDLLT